MFARIIRRDTGHSTIYDCSSVHLNRLTNEMQGDHEDNDKIIVDFESKYGCISVEIDKRTCELYLMNNEGRTIDSYRWYEPSDTVKVKTN